MSEPRPHDSDAAQNLDAEVYVISDERLAEIRGLIDWKHHGWQTIPMPDVTIYQLAGAVDDLLMERDDRG